MPSADVWNVFASSIIGVGALAAATANVRAARRAADAAADAISVATGAEKDRRRMALAPKFGFELYAAGPNGAVLEVRLEGPTELEALDEIAIVVRDDRPDRDKAPADAGTPPPEETRKVIWGPYRFSEGVSQYSRDGRALIWDGGLVVTDTIVSYLDRTVAPSWADAVGWPRQYDGSALRIRLDCRHGDLRWNLPYEISTLHIYDVEDSFMPPAES